MTSVSPVSRLPAYPSAAPDARPPQRTPAAGTRADAPVATPPLPAGGNGPVLAPTPSGSGRGHPALALYRDVQRLPGDGTDTWIGRIDMRV